jgi:HlyD family secretion protein
MNASVGFLSDRETTENTPAPPSIVIPASAVRDNAVFIVVDGKAVRRTIKTGGTPAQGIRIENGLIGGEDLIVNPPADLKDGEKVRVKA